MEQILDAFESALEEVLVLAEHEQYDDALARLDELWAEFGSKDEEHWIERAILGQRGAIYAEKGDFPKALEYLQKAQALRPEQLEYLANQETIALVLGSMGRHEDAIAQLEAGLERATGDGEGLALRLLILYAEIAKANGSRVPSRYGPLFIQSALQWNFKIPPEATANENVMTAVLAGMRDRLEEGQDED